MLDNHGKQNLYAILKATLLYAASQTVIFGSQAAGTIFSFAPDTSKAQRASADLHKLLGSVPEIDPSSDTGKKLTDLKGTIHLKGVHFTYPSRQETPILRGVDLKVEAGQLVALVGTSGCGKSTIVSLVERFYDPQEGSEATLYSGTIRTNLLLGTQTSDDSILEEDIIDACKNANIYGFITSLPEGSETVVGSRGSMLSGGQRQRIAITRALIRNPKILLLDEATSNMDAESEEIVQAALDKAASGRTTILVAHRLSTVRQADVIFVLDAGRIVEQGTHETLLSKKGCYYEMVHAQELDQDTGR
ncbi:multidrug resistance protein [Aureobasidium pullulans]|nr:multidrug resistance protein [Aureobasidium pullulans]